MTIKKWVYNELRQYFLETGEVPYKITLDDAKDMINDIAYYNETIDDEYSPKIIRKLYNDAIPEIKKAGYSICWRVQLRLYKDDELNQDVRERFNEPYHDDWSDSRGYNCIIDISALDENNYVYFRVTSDSLDHCYEEFDGQITDGAFENYDVINHEEYENSIETKLNELVEEK